MITDDVPYFEEDLPKKWKEENEAFIEQIKKECDSFIDLIDKSLLKIRRRYRGSRSSNERS